MLDYRSVDLQVDLQKCGGGMFQWLQAQTKKKKGRRMKVQGDDEFQSWEEL